MSHSAISTCHLKLSCQSLSAKKLYSDCLRDVAFEHAHLEVRTHYVKAITAFSSADRGSVLALLFSSVGTFHYRFHRGCICIPTTTQSDKQTLLASRMPFIMPRHRRHVSIYNTSSVSCDWIRDIGANPIRNLSWPWPMAANGIEMQVGSSLIFLLV